MISPPPKALNNQFGFSANQWLHKVSLQPSLGSKWDHRDSNDFCKITTSIFPIETCEQDMAVCYFIFQLQLQLLRTTANPCGFCYISANILTHSSIGTYSDVDLFSFLFSLDSYFFVDYLHQEVLMKSKVFVMRSWQFVMLKPAEALTSHVTLTDRSHEEDTGIRANSSKKKKKML